MNTRHTGLALLLAAGMLALTIHSVEAQAKPPAYLVIEVEVLDREAFREYAAKVPAALEAAGGKFLARGGQIISLAGTPPRRVTLVAFEDVDKAKAFLESPGFKELTPIRQKAVKLRSYILEGVAQ